ncbi:MAG: penicillin-binding protein 1C [Anaerolineae bacterium]|nr:penicillin-binding protein 1C [Anaerolineae bacterium]
MTTYLRRRFPLLITIFLSLLAIAGWAVYAWLVVDLPAINELPARGAVPSTLIYDRQERLLYEIIDPHGGKHTPLPLSDIPPALQQATIATEDANFYSNPGVDAWGILRALWINLRGGEVLAGGSTITQQLARNLLLDPQERGERTLTRKLRESILAWRLARTYSKDEILAFYLNQTYYGNLAYGVEAAAQAYFGKSVDELDLAECALLAGLPQAPALYNPITNPDAAKSRQEVVLDLMVKHGYLSAAEAQQAKAEPLHFAAVPFPIRAPHFVMYVWNQLEKTLGEEVLSQGGLRVYTTLDVDLQDAAQRIARRHLSRLASEGKDEQGHNAHNAALVALDPHSGQVLAMLGSPDYFDAEISGAVNAALALRQPGSAIKPITYAAAFSPDERDATFHPYTAATMVADVRTAFLTREGTSYVPMNYDRQWHGPVLLREALASSYNLPAVKVLDHVGLERMIDLARRLGISTFDDSQRFGLALTLGGGEVTLLELTAAYGAFATGGYKVEPISILRVEDATGRVLYKSPVGIGPRVLDPRVAYLITDILSDDTARMPSFGEGSVLHLTRPAAAKTGTTTDWRDNWTVGYTPDLVVGVWVGNADNSPMRDVSGISGAAPIWHDFMEEALKGRPALEFSRPDGLIEVEVCALSGLRPNAHCPHRRTELFIPGTEPTATCAMHQLVQLDAATGDLATADTPPDRIVERVITVLPPELVEWGQEHGLVAPSATAQRVAFNPQPETQNPKLLTITSPDPNSVFRLSPTLPADAQRILIAARPADGVSVARMTLYVDGEPLADLTTPPYRAWWTLQAGLHTVTAGGCDVEGNRLESEAVVIAVLE